MDDQRVERVADPIQQSDETTFDGVDDRVLQLLPTAFSRVVTACAFMLALAYAMFVFHVPNPNMILVAGLVVCSALFGFPGGLTTGTVMMGYALFFSEGNDFLTSASRRKGRAGGQPRVADAPSAAEATTTASRAAAPGHVHRPSS